MMSSIIALIAWTSRARVLKPKFDRPICWLGPRLQVHAPEADRMRQLMAFINTGFTGAFTPLLAALEGRIPEADKPALRAFGANQVRRRHDQLEQLLGDTPYAIADRPTLADGIFVGVARWVDFHQLGDPERWPRIAQLRARLESDPAVRFAASIEAGDEPAGSGAYRGHVSLAELTSAHGAKA